jgi:hypothetical protein
LEIGVPIAIPHPVTAAVCFVLAMLALAYGNMLVFAMVEQINRKSPAGAQESLLGYHPQKVIRIFDSYRRLCPDGRLHIYASLAVALMFLGMIGVAVSLGIIG